MSYQQHILSTGREVEVRPYTWNEFWELNIRRAEQREKEKDANAPEPEMWATARQLREENLTLLVRDFESMKASLTKFEVEELEKIISRISDGPVHEGNSAPSPATAAADV